ncbi:MAG: hypothetical protein KAU24_01440 [Candidatus Aenigmarchaeota archaeon]|nr:hypothetical protein [Candidatus Aenigmarchaeota archaeon]
MDLEKKKVYYASIEAELRSRRQKLLSLAKNPKILGDYYEDLFRDFLRSLISERYGIFHGGIYYEGNLFNEYDVIIVDTFEHHPIFRAGELLITDPKSIRTVIQVKGTLTKKGLEQSYKNLLSVRELNEGIMCFVFCFTNEVNIKEIIKKLDEENSPIHALYVLEESKYFSRGLKGIDFPKDFPALGHMIELMKNTVLKSAIKSKFRIYSSKSGI